MSRIEEVGFFICKKGVSESDEISKEKRFVRFPRGMLSKDAFNDIGRLLAGTRRLYRSS